VVTHNYQRDALVLVGHGTTQNADSAAPVFQHAAELRRRRIFAEVREAFWKQEPQIKEVLASVSCPRVFIAPLFISEGYFCERVIPRELGFVRGEGGELDRVQPRAGRTWVYCRPVGTHPSMTEVLLERAREVVRRFPFPRTPKPGDISLFIAGHGTGQDEQSSRAIEEQVERIRRLKIYAEVRAIYLDQSPHIQECHALAATRNLVVVPFFMSDGLHVREDIPILLGEPERAVRSRLEAGQPTWRNPTEKQGKLIWYAPAVGSEPRLADVIMERVNEMAAAVDRPFPA
jgi:sirohydrochlorin cobaltochelatase